MMLGERLHPPFTPFQPFAETTGKSSTMSTSAPTPAYYIRIRQQPGGRLRVGQPFPQPLIVESNPEDGLFFVAVLSDVQGKPSPVQLGGSKVVNGDGAESNDVGGGEGSKRKQPSSSEQIGIEHATFGDIFVPTKGRFTIVVHAMKIIDKESKLVGVLTTEAFDAV